MDSNPAPSSLAQAKVDLATKFSSLHALTGNLDEARDNLAKLVAESTVHIHNLERDRDALQAEISRTQAFMAPMRRLPSELLRTVFLHTVGEDQFCCFAWTLASVCTTWRRLALSIPVLWRKVRISARYTVWSSANSAQIRLVTSQHASADILRIWLERSGTSVPLDIEIYLRVNTPSPSDPPDLAEIPIPLAPTPAGTPISAIPSIPMPQHPAHHYDTWHTPSALSRTASATALALAQSKMSPHWGHIFTYYMVLQIHRWERFVFRFDKPFPSMAALKTLVGMLNNAGV